MADNVEHIKEVMREQVGHIEDALGKEDVVKEVLRGHAGAARDLAEQIGLSVAALNIIINNGTESDKSIISTHENATETIGRAGRIVTSAGEGNKELGQAGSELEQGYDRLYSNTIALFGLTEALRASRDQLMTVQEALRDAASQHDVVAADLQSGFELTAQGQNRIEVWVNEQNRPGAT